MRARKGSQGAPKIRLAALGVWEIRRCESLQLAEGGSAGAEVDPVTTNEEGSEHEPN